MHTYMLPFCSACFHSTHIFTFDVLPCQIACMLNQGLHALYFLRVLCIFFRMQLSHDLSCSRSPMCVKPGVQCILAALLLSWVACCLLHDAWHWLMQQSYSDCVPVPGHGEQFCWPTWLHCALHQCADECLIQNLVSCVHSAGPWYVSHYPLSPQLVLTVHEQETWKIGTWYHRTSINTLPAFWLAWSMLTYIITINIIHLVQRPLEKDMRDSGNRHHVPGQPGPHVFCACHTHISELWSGPVQAASCMRVMAPLRGSRAVSRRHAHSLKWTWVAGHGLPKGSYSDSR